MGGEGRGDQEAVPYAGAAKLIKATPRNAMGEAMNIQRFVALGTILPWAPSG